MKRRLRLVLLITVSATLLSLVTGVAWCHFGLIRAERFAKFGLWAEAREALDLYMLVHPGGDHARLLYAESLVKDPDLLVRRKVDMALRQLRLISDSSPLGATARVQEGRLYLLLRYQPTRAERALRRAIELDPDSLEAHVLLWKLLDLTGRSHLAESIAWRVYELSPEDEKPLRLREWFSSQFFPATANPDFDEIMGFVDAENPLSVRTEALRFIRFRNEEPDAPLGYASLARWFQLEGDPQFALGVLRQGEAKMRNEDKDPYYLFTAISLLMDVGENDLASEMFELWPEDQRTGYEYWLTRARVLHEIRGEYSEAVTAYNEALSIWPGVLDWTSWNRKADCLARMGDTAGAAEIRERAAAIGQRIDQDRLLQIRDLLQNLGDPRAVQEVSDYYRALGRTREADCWADYLAQLKAAPPADEVNGEAADVEMQPFELPVGKLPNNELPSNELPAGRSGIDGPQVEGPATQDPTTPGPLDVDSTDEGLKQSEGTPPSAASDSAAEPSAR